VDLTRYAVMGCKRSGHHAIAYWVMLQIPGGAVFHNDCNGRLEAARLQVIGEGKHSLHLLEDFDLCGWSGLDLQDHFDRPILVLRDGYNWAASVVRSNMGRKATWEPYRRIQIRTHERDMKWFGGTLGRLDTWKQHVSRALDGVLPKNALVVNYNKWCADEEYRKELSTCLGLPFNDIGRRLVPPFGHGSSFDKMKFDGHAEDMETLTRWKTMKSDPEWKLMVDKEVRHLTREYFGYTPNTN